MRPLSIDRGSASAGTLLVPICLTFVFYAMACSGKTIDTLRSTSTPRRLSVDKRRADHDSLYHGMIRRIEVVMGTALMVALDEAAIARSSEDLFEGVFARVRSWDAILSNYRPQSPLSRLNRESGGTRYHKHPLLVRFVRDALDYSRRTLGAFDASAGALFAAHRRSPLGNEKIRALIRLCGRRGVSFSKDGGVRLEVEGARFDPGAIGKGYALDGVRRYLRSRGVMRAFIDFGGSSFLALGQPSGQPGWPVAIRSTHPGKSLGLIYLRDEALSSSGSQAPLESPPEGEGNPNNHIVDPRNGMLITQARISAVISRSATDAEVLSTALIVDPKLAAHLVREFPESWVLVQTKGHPPIFRPHRPRRLIW